MQRRTLLLAAPLILAGCAKKGDSGGGGTATLNVGQISNSVAFLPFYAGEQKNLFTGIKLGERPRLGTGAKVAAALQSGSIDVAGAVMTDAFNLYKTNPQARLIGTLVDTYYVDIIAGASVPATDDKSPLEARIASLKGRKIGITGPGSGTEALVKYLFKQGGLDTTKDATLVNLGSDNSAALGALAQKRVDFLSFFQPVGQLAVAAGAGRIYISPAAGDIPALQHATHGVIITTQSVLDSKSDAVGAFLRGVAAAETLIHSDASATSQLLAGYQDTMKPETVATLAPILQQEIPASPLPQEAGYTASVTFHQQSGLFPTPPSFADMVPIDWITAALK